MKLPKVYEPQKYEADIYALWEKSQAFQPHKAGKSYSVVVPPPNANGNLHIGHALNLSLLDIAVRYHRLKGESALLLPGADHAGFETQVVYERELAKAGKSRFDFTREQLYANIWDFVAANRENYENQFRRLGAGVDWSRFTFTLDKKIVFRAYETFKKMWDEGLIYRGERLVNFCTYHGTAFADIEVDYKEEQGKLWHIRYPLTDDSGEIIVATTRPETMLGDTAVAVHKDDPRYLNHHGKTVKLPLVGREIPIVTDDTFIDPAFGTGAVKITPAHDPNDFALGERYALPMMTVIDHEGKMNAEVPDAYRGLSVEAARDKVVADLEEQGYLIKVEDYAHNVGHCYKCGTIIQPMLRDQWFVDMQPLATPAIEALRDEKVAFYPSAKKEQLITYLENLRDWNISRQIAWGIPIPAFQNVNNPDDWIYDERVELEIIEVDGKTYRRDPDVFDTWFSSGSWPYATLNYPESDFDEFYPLNLMATGSDILYPWVSRMMMLGLYITGESPFDAVYLHGLVLDEHGQKMSKSKGNVVNPLEIADEYGSDALRMGLIAGQSAGNNQPFGLPKVIGARNFANKLWNIARYIEARAGDKSSHGTVELQTDADHWMMYKLHQFIEGIDSELDAYRFAEAYERLYHFVWDDFADWYIEAAKAQENIPLLQHALEAILKAAHPFAPFVTETIWQTLPWNGDTLLATSEWPVIEAGLEARYNAFEQIKDIIAEVRDILQNIGEKTGDLEYVSHPIIEENTEIIQRMAKINSLTPVTSSTGLKLTSTSLETWVAIGTEVAERYAHKLEEKRAAETEIIARLQSRLSNKNYVDNAPEMVVAQTKQQLAESEERLAAIKTEEARFV